MRGLRTGAGERTLLNDDFSSCSWLYVLAYHVPNKGSLSCTLKAHRFSNLQFFFDILSLFSNANEYSILKISFTNKPRDLFRVRTFFKLFFFQTQKMKISDHVIIDLIRDENHKKDQKDLI